MAKYNIAQLQGFFLEMAANAYASGAKAVHVPGHPWEREFRRERGELTYIDRYVVNGEYSGGGTAILVESIPAWLMHYNGWCKNDDPVVLNVLKSALLENYRRGIFYGGRGPKVWQMQVGNVTYLYGNKLDPASSFVNFLGGEGIFNKEVYDALPNKPSPPEIHEAALFWHRFGGQLLGEPE